MANNSIKFFKHITMGKQIKQTPGEVTPATGKKKEVHFSLMPLDELQANIQVTYEQTVARAIKAVKSEEKTRERSALSVLGSIRYYLKELETLNDQADVN